MERINALQDAGAPLLRSGRRDEIAHQIRGGLLEHAGRLAACVTIDRARLRIRRIRRDLRETQSNRVRDTIVTGRVLQPDRIVGGDRINVRRKQIAPLCELAFIPAITLQPFAGLEARDGFANPADGLGNRRDVAQLHVIELADATVGDMSVAVDESRRCRPAIEIDPAGLAPGEAQYFLRRADGNDLAPAHCQGFCNGVLGVDRQNRAMKQHEIGGLRRSRVARSAKCRLGEHCRHANEYQGFLHAGVCHVGALSAGQVLPGR